LCRRPESGRGNTASALFHLGEEEGVGGWRKGTEGAKRPILLQVKTLWIVLGVLGGLCLICAVGGYFLYAKVKGGFDEAGKFGDDSFRAIASNWDAKEF
jgi:hypothetical protein